MLEWPVLTRGYRADGIFVFGYAVSMTVTQSHIRFIYFDLGNVLLHFDREIAFGRLAELSEVTPERVREILQDQGLQDRYERGNISTAEFHQEYSAAVGKQLERDSMLEAGNAMFRANVPLIPVVTQLVAANQRLGILSNTCEAHWDYCCDGRFGILSSAFEISVLSFQVGAMKPDLAIYEAAIKSAGVSPDEIFFTDDLTENVEAAKEYGIDAVTFTSVSQLVAELRQRGIPFGY